MKCIAFGLILMTSFSAFSATVKSTRQNMINVSRIDKVITLVAKPDIKVNVVVEDLGGSTDLSPTQNLYFTLYSKGEMADVDATFNLGSVYSVTSAKRISGGVYEVQAVVPGDDESIMQEKTIKINAAEAIVKLKAVDCGTTSECKAAKNFSATIEVK